ncbi:Tn3 family transposase, partial [Escherichia coli]|nr:Tn3 family transposase [Escherichia coli]EFO4726409.1 Tn3 family transposase [Escherichia coli]
DVGQALSDARDSGGDPWLAIENILPWAEFVASLDETRHLARKNNFDPLHIITEKYSTLRKYAPRMLSALQLVATPAAQPLADALVVIKDMYRKQSRKVPAAAPLEFVPESWRKVVITPVGIDRQYYEFCALSELKGALRSGDIWVKGSRRYKNFDDYLIPEKDFDKLTPALPLPVSADYHEYITSRMTLLQSRLEEVNAMAALGELPDVEISDRGVKVSPLDNCVPAQVSPLAELVNAQGKRPLAAFWGDGTTSSSDGQNFRTGSSGRYAGQVNPKYGQEPGRQFYTHISDQYSPFYTCIISRVRDSTHVLDGLLYHESDLEIREHYTDTAGFTDHVFALMHLLGFAFCPRIRDLHDKKLFIKGKAEKYPALQSLISTTSLNLKEIEIHWREVLRLATSIKQGTVTASLMLKKLASYPKQNGLAKALREIGRIERTLFMLDWFRDPALRRRVQAGLNKGEARNALARAVFMHRLGEIRDRKPENQSYRASGLTLLTAAISLWNTVYMERAVDALKRKGVKINEQLLSHLSPLGWEHINLTGDYIWKSNRIPASGKFRRLRPAKVERSKNSLNVQ